MTSVSNVTGVSVVAMDIGDARVSVAYIGNMEQLQDALSARGISLSKSGGEWVLSGSAIQ